MRERGYAQPVPARPGQIGRQRRRDSPVLCGAKAAACPSLARVDVALADCFRFLSLLQASNSGATAGVISEEKDPYMTQEAEYAQLLDLLKIKPAAAPTMGKGAATVCYLCPREAPLPAPRD